MATWQHLRSSTANKRPTTSLADGRIAINTNTASPGLFFKDSAGTGIVKVGPVHVGTTAPNSVPAAGGSSGNYTGEQWLDTSVSPAQMKVWNGSTWVGIVADELPVSKLQDGAARQLIQTDAAGTGVEWTSDVDVPGTLDVTSTATFDSIAQHPLGTAGAPTITFTGDNNTGIYSPGADQVAISTGGSGRLFVDASGRVGVGTSSPTFLSGSGLEIFDTSVPRLKLTNSTTGTGSSDGLDIHINNTDANIVVRENFPLLFYTNNTERLRITSAGLVGVGTSAPLSTLTVSDSTATNGTITLGNNASYNGQINYTFSTGELRISQVGGSSLGTTFYTNGSERLRIDSSGRVGIGTSTTTLGGNPFRLVVVGTKTYSELIPRDGLAIADNTATAQGVGGSITLHGIYDGSGNYTAFGGIEGQKENGTSGNYAGALVLKSRTFLGNLNEAIRIDSAQRVGIGTTNPGSYSAQLAVSGGRLAVVYTASGIELDPQFGFVAGTVRAYDRITSSYKTLGLTGDTVAFGISDIEKARIDSSGRLLVGTSSARSQKGIASRLQVENTAYDGISLVVNNNGTADTCPALLMARSRGAALTSSTIVANNDRLAALFFQGADGTSIDSTAGSIECFVDGTPGANDMPGRLVFSVTADGASSPTEAMRIKNSRILNFANTPVYADNAAAKTGGLVDGDVYRKSDGTLMIVYT